MRGDAMLERLLEQLLGVGARGRLGDRLRPLVGPGRHLDVGCGAASRLRGILETPFGVDLEHARIARFGRHGAVATACRLPYCDEAFDSVWSFGLLHHLSDSEVRITVTEMLRVTRAGGTTIIFDGVLPRAAWQRPLANAIRRLDRGRFVRHAEALLLLLGPGWSMQRFTYSWSGLEGLLCTRPKQSPITAAAADA